MQAKLAEPTAVYQDMGGGSDVNHSLTNKAHSKCQRQSHQLLTPPSVCCDGFSYTACFLCSGMFGVHVVLAALFFSQRWVVDEVC